MSATSLASEIASGRLSAFTVCSAFCHCAALAHQLLNCCSEIFFDEALQRAKDLDNYYLAEKGKVIGPLHGVPISLKDQFNIEGVECAIGYISLLGTKAAKKDESNLVKLLRDAGAVFYVKTTVPPAMMSGETASNIYGKTLNAFNRKLSSGGSSGGEGTLIAAHGSTLGVGTDIGGSVRLPSAFNGLYCLKPSHGRIPYWNVTNSYSGQDTLPSVAGPMAQHLCDINLFMKTVSDSEPWLYDQKVIPLPWRDLSHFKDMKLCFGLMTCDGFRSPFPPVQRALEEVKNALEAAGHQVVTWNPPSHSEAIDITTKIFLADAGQEVIDTCHLSGEPLVPEVGLVHMYQQGKQSPLQISEYFEASRNRYEYAQRYYAYWNNTKNTVSSTGRPVDAYISPVHIAPSFRAGDSFILNGSYTRPQNAIDAASVVLPVTKAKLDDIDPPNFKPVNPQDAEIRKYYDPLLYDGMPVSVQVVTRRHEEEKAVVLGQVVLEAIKAK